jgi:hypothetical protein
MGIGLDNLERGEKFKCNKKKKEKLKQKRRESNTRSTVTHCSAALNARFSCRSSASNRSNADATRCHSSLSSFALARLATAASVESLTRRNADVSKYLRVVGVGAVKWL